MMRQVAATAVFAAVALGSAGCTACHHGMVTNPSVCPDTCAAQRNRVHVFLVNGYDPLDDGGMIDLRNRLHRVGYTRIYCGNTFHRGWFGRELRRIAIDDPQARFVVVGYESGAGNALALAADAHCLGRPVDAVVLLDPASVAPAACELVGAPVHVIVSDQWPLPESLSTSDVMKLADIGHFSLAANPETVRLIIDRLAESVQHVPDESVGLLALPLIDDPAPMPALIPDVATPAGRVSAPRNRWTQPSTIQPVKYQVPRR